MNKEKGSALISVLLFVTIVGVLSVPLFQSVLQDRVILEIENVKTQNHYAVESGLELIKAAQPTSKANLQLVINAIDALPEFENLVDTEVNMVIDEDNREIIIETDGNRLGSDIKGNFGYLFGEDIFFSNIFVSGRFANQNNPRASTTVSLTPNSGNSPLRTYNNDMASFLTVVSGHEEEFKNRMMDLIEGYVEPTGTKICSIGNSFPVVIDHLYCTSNYTKKHDNFHVTFNNDVFVNGNFIIEGRKQNHNKLKVTGNLYVNGTIDFKYINKIEVGGNLIAYNGDIVFRDVDEIDVGGRFIASRTINIAHPGNGIKLNTRSVAAGGYNTSGSSSLINIHAHSDSTLFQNDDASLTPTEGQMWITHWNVGN